MDYDVHEDDTLVVYYEEDYEYTSAVSSSFDFPGFRFKCPYQYEVQLQTFGRCGVKSHVDTVEIPLSATIAANRTKIFNLPGALSSATLTGSITGTTSYTWSPESYLELIINVTPEETTSYILSVSENGCTDADTITIKVNNLAYAGEDIVACMGSNVEIGFNQNLGFTYSWDPEDYLDDPSTPYTMVYITKSMIYTLYVIAGADTLETDEVRIFADTIVIPEFDIFADTAFRYCFDNTSFPASPTTTYSWDFGDGNTSTFVNPCHTYDDHEVDTFYVVCLTSENSCGQTIWCNTLFMDSEGSPQVFEKWNPAEKQENNERERT
jgi:hypothetical protein